MRAVESRRGGHTEASFGSFISLHGPVARVNTDTLSENEPDVSTTALVRAKAYTERTFLYAFRSFFLSFATSKRATTLGENR